MNETPTDLSRRNLLAVGMGAASAALLASGCQLNQSLAKPAQMPDPEPLALKPDGEIRVGIIGIGGRGTGVLDAINKSRAVRVTAVCDINPDNLDRAAKMVADDKPTKFTDYHKMLESDLIDAVVVETPCYLHAPMVVDVLATGRHCYAEKPMAISTRDLDAMVAAVAKSKRVYQVGTQLPYAAPWAAAIKAINDGQIGEPILIRAHRHNAGDLPHHIEWFFKRKLCGDTILEQAVHEFDIFNAILQGIPERASGSGGQAMLFEPKGRDIRDHYGVVYEYGKNKRVSYSHSWIAAPGVPADGRQEIVYGTEGTVDVEAGMIYPRKGEARSVGNEPAGDSTQLAIDGFFDCIRTGRKPLTDVIRGRNSALVALLGLKALDTGRVVTMNEIVNQGYTA